ncbi:hypothetical protein [Leifsonia sp. C5G2]|uniref:hypothetical protein n=1 Tax=Leifsonia sp. C5G2 TaxID=2735269 RepID=UPI0015849E50|nr:hypothetical protein [Leifsonia sp. C5G2]NUU05145.1 hypothetical protein [Leifsonia sp. C5G2]
MPVIVPTVKHQHGINVELQSVELLDSLILLRFRATELVESGAHGTLRPTVMNERITLEDSLGTQATQEQKSSDSGPFAGLVDVAFSLPPKFDTAGQMLLQSENLSLAFTI